MTSPDAERLERERLDAERRYNDALTALDRAVVATAAGPQLERDDVARIMSALIVFLQQITAFVETKDRLASAVTARGFDLLAPSLDAISELRAQLGVVQRTVRSLERARETPPADRPAATTSAAPAPAREPASSSADVTYLAFEDQFRGSPDAIAARLRGYLPIFAGRANVVDLGCGRGEFLAVLKEAGISARGIDANAEMAALARDHGLYATHGDALRMLQAEPDGTLGGVIATQVVEHLEPAYLISLIETASRKLQPGAPIVLETINPTCWLAFFSSYLRDPTHVKPVHPDTLQYLLRANGFVRVEVRYSAPVPDQVKMRSAEVGLELARSADPAAQALTSIAHAVNTNASILNDLLFSHLDYAAIGYRL